MNQYCKGFNIKLILHGQKINKKVQNDKENFIILEYVDYFNIIIQSELSDC